MLCLFVLLVVVRLGYDRLGQYIDLIRKMRGLVFCIEMFLCELPLLLATVITQGLEILVTQKTKTKQFVVVVVGFVFPWVFSFSFSFFGFFCVGVFFFVFLVPPAPPFFYSLLRNSFSQNVHFYYLRGFLTRMVYLKHDI